MAKKILSLDGGGSWALLQAMALKETYKDTAVGTNCREILNQFDLVVANSGGSLTLAAMIEHADDDMDLVIQKFLDYETRKAIFSELKLLEKPFLKLTSLLGFGPKYRANRKLAGLLKALPISGPVPLKYVNDRFGIKPHIIICGFDYDSERASFFRSRPNKSHANQDKDYRYRLVDAVNAASNAPVNYFDEPVAFNYDGGIHRYWDGAIGGNNNPVVIGLSEAFAVFGNVVRNVYGMKVLSIGTGNNLIPVEGHTISNLAAHPRLLKKKEMAILPRDILKMASSIISEPPEAANYIAHMILGGKPQPGSRPAIVRMNPLVAPELYKGIWSIPRNIPEAEKEKFIQLIDLDMDAVKPEEVGLIELLGKWWLKDITYNQPIRIGNEKLDCNIGHPYFSQAKAAWLSQSQDKPGVGI